MTVTDRTPGVGAVGLEDRAVALDLGARALANRLRVLPVCGQQRKHMLVEEGSHLRERTGVFVETLPVLLGNAEVFAQLDIAEHDAHRPLRVIERLEGEVG